MPWMRRLRSFRRGNNSGEVGHGMCAVLGDFADLSRVQVQTFSPILVWFAIALGPAQLLKLLKEDIVDYK